MAVSTGILPDAGIGLNATLICASPWHTPQPLPLFLLKLYEIGQVLTPPEPGPPGVVVPPSGNVGIPSSSPPGGGCENVIVEKSKREKNNSVIDSNLVFIGVDLDVKVGIYPFIKV